MPHNIKIISVLTFSILTLHSQLHAKEIYKGLNNSNNEEFSIFNPNQSKVKNATLAGNYSQVKEYGDFFPDYKAETLEDFLHEYSEVGIAANEFSRFFKGKHAYKKRRCPLICPNVIHSYNEKKRKVKQIKGYLNERINKSNVAPSLNSGWNDGSVFSLSKKYHFKTTTPNILFPSFQGKSRLPVYHYSESLGLTTIEGDLDPKQSYDAPSMKSKTNTNFPSNDYLTTNFYPQVMYENKTKYFYDPNKSTKTIRKGDRLPGEGYLFDTTTSKVFQAKESHVSDLLYQKELLPLRFDNESGIMHNAPSNDQVIDRYMPSMINSLRNSNTGRKIKGNGIDYQNNSLCLTEIPVSENNIADFLTPTKQYGPSTGFDSNLILASALGSFASADKSLRNPVGENVINNLTYYNENKEKTQSKTQQEALFISEKDYKVYEKHRRNMEAARRMKENLYIQNSNVNISNIERGSRLPQELQQPKTEVKESNDVEIYGKGTSHSTSGILHHPIGQSAWINNTLNQSLSAVSLSKRLAYEKKHDYENNNILKNLYEDYDYYFMLGDNNTYESPFQNDYRSLNIATSKHEIEKSNSNNELNQIVPVGIYKSEKSKNLTLDRKNVNTSLEKTNFMVNNTVGIMSTISPNIIQKFWPNVGNKEKLSLQDGKNYILNLFRRKGNYSKVNELTSSTPAQTLIRNFFFRKRSNGHGDELGRKYRNEILEGLPAKDEYCRKKIFSNRKIRFSNPLHDILLASGSSGNLLRNIGKRNVETADEEFKKQNLLRKSLFESKDGDYFTNIKDVFKICERIERKKRKSGIVNKGPLSHKKYPRRSIVNGENDDYSIKFQNLQKDLLELQRAISSPRAARPARNEEKNLTLQIRVIVDVVNNSASPTESPEDDQLKKRDTKLAEKKSNLAKIDVIPMPLEHDSPLVEEKKGTNVWRNKRVDATINESQKNNLLINEKDNSSNNDLSDDIIRNITYLLDNLLENYKLTNGDGKKSMLDHTVTSNPEYSDDQILKNSFIHLRNSQTYDLKTFKPMISGDYNFSSLLGDSKKQDPKYATLDNNKNLFKELKKIFPSDIWTSLGIRNRRATNAKQSKRVFSDYNQKLFQDEINALYNIVENIKNKLIFKKIMDSIESEDNLSNGIEPLHKEGKTPEVTGLDSPSKNNENDLKFNKNGLEENDAKVGEILETIGNIGRELKQIDFKQKILRDILDSDLKNAKVNHKNRNKVKIMRKKNYIASSLKSKKGDCTKSARSNLKKVNKPIRKDIIVVESRKTTKATALPPCCEESTVDEGNHLSVNWCCGVENTNKFFASSHVESPVGSTAESSTSVQNTTQTGGGNKTLSTQNTKQAIETTTSLTHTTKVEKSSSTTEAKKEASTSGSSSTPTTQHSGSSTHSTQTTTKSPKKRHHDPVYEKYSRFREIYN